MDEKENLNSEELFDQDAKEDEDFEVLIFKKTEVLMIKLKINEKSNIISGIIPFSSDVK